MFARVPEPELSPDAAPVVEDRGGVDAAQDRKTLLAIRREEPVVGAACVKGAYLGRLLTPTRWVVADPPLALHGDGTVVERSERQHPLQHVDEDGLVEVVGQRPSLVGWISRQEALWSDAVPWHRSTSTVELTGTTNGG
jgi:hypothetical protein